MHRGGGCIVGVVAVSSCLFTITGLRKYADLMKTVAFIGAALIVCVVRGPREPGWFGWTGGWAIRKDDLPPKIVAAGPSEETVEEAPGAAESRSDEEKARGS